MATKKLMPSSSANLDPELIGELDRRLARLEGHVRGVRKMLADQRDCDDILTQVAGVKAAASQIAIRLLEGHFDCCLSDLMPASDGEEQVEGFKNSLKRVLR